MAIEKVVDVPFAQPWRNCHLQSAPAGLDPERIETDFRHLITVEDRLTREPSGRASLRRTRRLGAIVLDDKIIGPPDRAQLTKALQRDFETRGPCALRWGEASTALRARLRLRLGLGQGLPALAAATRRASSSPLA